MEIRHGRWPMARHTWHTTESLVTMTSNQDKARPNRILPRGVKKGGPRGRPKGRPRQLSDLA